MKPLVPSPLRWAMIGFAFTATTLNYVQRLSFTYLSAHPDLRALFSDAAFGTLGTVFFLAYTVSNGVSGFAIDRLGTRVGYALYMAFWTTAALLHALLGRLLELRPEVIQRDAMVPFVVADLGNILGGLFTQGVIRRGVPVPTARKLAVSTFALTMAAALLSGPWLISGPRSALAVLATAGFGWAAYTANTLAFPADVVPQRATATVWGLASVGAGLGGAFFQQVSGLAIAHLRTTIGVSGAYHTVFVGYGLVALVGLAIVLFPMGPLTRDEALQ